MEKIGGSTSKQAQDLGPRPESSGVLSSRVENSELKKRGSDRGWGDEMLAVFRSRLKILWNTVYDHMVIFMYCMQLFV